MSLSLKNVSRIDFPEIEDEIKPVVVRLRGIVDDSNYQAKTLLSRYEMLLTEKHYLGRYL